MFKINFFWLILIAICIMNCSYTILKHRSNESIDLIKEQPENMNDEYTPPITTEPIIILPEPPKIPISPSPPIKPDPIISEPIQKITPPNTENLTKKRPFDKRTSLENNKGKNSTKRKEKRNR